LLNTISPGIPYGKGDTEASVVHHVPPLHLPLALQIGNADGLDLPKKNAVCKKSVNKSISGEHPTPSSCCGDRVIAIVKNPDNPSRLLFLFCWILFFNG